MTTPPVPQNPYTRGPQSGGAVDDAPPGPSAVPPPDPTTTSPTSGGSNPWVDDAKATANDVVEPASSHSRRWRLVIIAVALLVLIAGVVFAVQTTSGDPATETPVPSATDSATPADTPSSASASPSPSQPATTAIPVATNSTGPELKTDDQNTAADPQAGAGGATAAAANPYMSASREGTRVKISVSNLPGGTRVLLECGTDRRIGHISGNGSWTATFYRANTLNSCSGTAFMNREATSLGSVSF